MGCATCSNNGNGQPRGCQSNGTCGTDSCNKMTVFDWLSNMRLPDHHSVCPFVEVRFKNSRKGFYHLPKNQTLQVGDLVTTEVERGYDLGMVTLTGELVRMQMKRKKVAPESESIGNIIRKATPTEIETWIHARNREKEVQKRTRELAIALNLEMKLSDVEFQGDGKKATFYYTADSRVDFRQLIKDMAQAFSIRIEMRQIGLRQEASRLGGIGSCGRELCCSTWLSDFRTVSTGAARYQQLSLNPQKLAGQCGKLKCCLNYELDAYRTALKDFPRTEIKLQTEKGVGICQKIDIFKGVMWYTYKNEWMTWHKLRVENVKVIIEKNQANIPVTSLEEYEENTAVKPETALLENVVGQDSLNRFDRQGKKKTGKRSNKRRNNRKKPQRNA